MNSSTHQDARRPVHSVAEIKGQTDRGLLVSGLLNRVDRVTSPNATKVEPPPPFVIGKNGRKFFRYGCRARGVSNDHTAETAYLLIPEDASHGYFLWCSHNLCVKTGRRFRYCVVCRQAVTRRNFHKRHGHGLIRYDDDGSPILPPSSGVIETKPVTVVASVCQSLNPMPPPPKRPRTNRSQEPDGEKKPAPVVPAISAAVATIALRPGNGRSECGTQRQGGFVSSAAASSSSGEEPRKLGPKSKEEAEWLRLLRERPKLSSQKEPAISKWLATLLELSYPASLHRRSARSTTTRPIRQLDSSDEEVIAEINATLGDFDQDLDNYKGDWSLMPG